MPPEITARVRRPAGEPEGLIVLLHGRGANEDDLSPLFDILDPPRRFLGITPRGPLSLPPGGAHWYQLAGIPTPDPDTFWPTFEALTEWLDALEESTGVPFARTALGGFSQGCVMSYALTYAADRPRPAAFLAFSGFMPEVEGLDLDLDPSVPVAMGHGTYDQVIPPEWGRAARARLERAGAKVLFRESPMPHSIDPGFAAELAPWLVDALLG